MYTKNNYTIFKEIENMIKDASKYKQFNNQLLQTAKNEVNTTSKPYQLQTTWTQQQFKKNIDEFQSFIITNYEEIESKLSMINNTIDDVNVNVSTLTENNIENNLPPNEGQLKG